MPRRKKLESERCEYRFTVTFENKYKKPMAWFTEKTGLTDAEITQYLLDKHADNFYDLQLGIVRYEKAEHYSEIEKLDEREKAIIREQEAYNAEIHERANREYINFVNPNQNMHADGIALRKTHVKQIQERYPHLFPKTIDKDIDEEFQKIKAEQRAKSEMDKLTSSNQVKHEK
jgi:hypothetical protein